MIQWFFTFTTHFFDKDYKTNQSCILLNFLSLLNKVRLECVNILQTTSKVVLIKCCSNSKVA